MRAVLQSGKCALRGLILSAAVWAGIDAAAMADTLFTMTRQATGGGVYPPGGALDITIELNLVTAGVITAIGLEETIPQHWTFDSVVSGDVPAIQPFPGVSGLLEFGWFPLPQAYPIAFTYRVAVPETDTGPQQITGNGVGRILPGGAIVTTSVTSPFQEPSFPIPDVRGLTRDIAELLLIQAGFVPGAVSSEYSASVALDRVKRTDPATGSAAVAGTIVQIVLSLGQGDIHSGDIDQNGVINLTELLRVIQFFNAGGYHCPSTEITEDGYASGPGGDQSCSPHDGDANQDWVFSLAELLRLVQFFNAGGYHYCPGMEPPTEDGFCPIP